MTIERITDYEDQAEALLPGQFKRIYGGTDAGQQTLFAQEIRAFAAQVQELEDAFWVLYDKRNVNYSDAPSNTSRNVLDDFGDNHGITRGGATDAVFAVLIKAKIQAEKSCGEPNRLINFLKALTSTARCWYADRVPAGITIVFTGTSVPDNTNNYMQAIKTGGVELAVVLADPDLYFQFGVRGFGTGHLSQLLT